MGSLVKKVVESRWAQLLIGGVLIVTSALEVGETLAEDLRSGDFSSEHGVMIYGTWIAIRGLADILEGAEYLTPE